MIDGTVLENESLKGGKMARYYTSLFAGVGILLASAQSCKPMEKYEWLPTESAFRRYPMRIVKGDLFLQDGSSLYIPNRRTIKNGWGKIGSTHVVGEARKALPVKLAITWLSYTEDKFYAGEFELPTQRIQQLFKKGVIARTSGKPAAYSQLIVGMAPEGGISVWLSAPGVVTEVATFQANEAQVDWKRVLDNPEIGRQQFIEKRLAEALSPEDLLVLKKEGIPKGVWRKYTRQYRWSPEVAGVKSDRVWMATFNGEVDFTGSSTESARREKRGVPNQVSVAWVDGDANRFSTNIDFDEDEIFRAFSKFEEIKSEAPLKLLVEVGAKSHGAVVSLKGPDHILQLEKCKVETFSQ